MAALGWTYAAMGRRVLTGTRISGLLVLAALGISVQLVPIPHSSPSTLRLGSPDAVLRWRCSAS